jgi:hypothetical protein
MMRPQQSILAKAVMVQLMLLVAQTLTVEAQQRPSSAAEIMGRRVSKTLQILSPLQSLTFFSKETTSSAAMNTPRARFLPKFRAGLTAETRTKERLARRRELMSDDDSDSVGVGDVGWEKQMEMREKVRAEKEEGIVDRAWDRATLPFDTAATQSAAAPNAKYQFVGVIQPPNSNKKVKWYARKRPKGSKWNIRMLHVNKDAIIRDMFTSGKVDIMGKYVNTGQPLDELKEGGEERSSSSSSLAPRIQAQYSVKPRSLLNLWNFSPKHFFTDSSGAFWRERRLSPGLYTDGKLVYESSYRYTDGKNGMKPISRLDALLKSKVIKRDIKTKLVRRLKSDAPDVVIEE